MQKSTILDRLTTALGQSESFGPVADERIDAAERTLGVTFPVSYRTFLRVFGASLCHGCCLPGLPDAPLPGEMPFWDDVVLVNAQIRRFGGDNIPQTLVYVSDDGCDDKFYLDTSVTDSEGESPVVVLGPGRHYEIVASSYAEFVEKVVSRILF